MSWTRPSEAEVASAVSVLTDYAAALTDQMPVPGGTFAVVDRDGLVAQSSWGLADAAAREPMRPDHRFEIGSISKVVTAIVVHGLVDEGLLDLDQPVTEVVPWLDLGAPDAVITPRHLLSHTAGLVLGADAYPDERAQVWAMRNLTRSGEPGERFHYSNLGFMTLGVLCSHVTGRPFAELVHERVLEPIGAPGARPVAVHADRATMATGHWPLHDDRQWAPGDPVGPATWFEIASADGNVAASAAELACLARFLLDDGELDGRRVLTPESMRALVTPWAPGGEGVCEWGATPGFDDSHYGLGINVEDIGGHHCVTHGGGMVGYATFLLADRDAGLGVVVLTNGTGEHPMAHAFARVVHRAFVELGQGRAITPVPDPSAAVRVDELPAALLGRFGGTSHSGETLTIELRTAADGAVEVLSGVATWRLLRTWSGRFVTDHPDLRTFPLTPDGERWCYGPFVLATGPILLPPLDDRLTAVAGHYRTWSPWFTNFRVVARDGGLVLIAPGGVEAPGEDQQLVEVEPGVFRIGADPWLPERLVVGPVVDGQAVTVTRDGCVYSRAFTD